MNIWKRSFPPKDGKPYEMKRRMRNAGGQFITVAWAESGRWNGQSYVRRSQIHGSEVALIPEPNRWRP